MLTDITGNKSVAEQFLVRSLEICAHDHDLSSRILDVVRKRSGRVQIMFEAWFDPNSADLFDAFPAEPPGTVRSSDDNPYDEMGRFVVDYHRHAAAALTVAEDWAADSKTPLPRFRELSAEDRAQYSLPAEDRVLYYGSRDFYNCVSGRDVLLDDAEFLVRPAATRRRCCDSRTHKSSSCAAERDGRPCRFSHVCQNGCPDSHPLSRCLKA